MLEHHLFTALLSGTAVVALGLAFRLGMGLLGIYPVLRSEGEEVAVASWRSCSWVSCSWGWSPSPWWPSGSGRDPGTVRHPFRFVGHQMVSMSAWVADREREVACRRSLTDD